MTKASFLKRALAWLIDMNISMILLVLAYLATVAADRNLEGAAVLVTGIVAYNVWWWIGFYNRCYLMGRTGRSWGRRVVGIDLYSEKTGKPIGVLRAFIRENLHFADWLTLGIGFLLPIWDRKKRQTIADKIMRTITLDPRAVAGSPAPAVATAGADEVRSPAQVQ